MHCLSGKTTPKLKSSTRNFWSSPSALKSRLTRLASLQPTRCHSGKLLTRLPRFPCVYWCYRPSCDTNLCHLARLRRRPRWSRCYGHSGADRQTISTSLRCSIVYSVCVQVLSLMWMRTTMNYQVDPTTCLACCPHSHTDPQPTTAVPPWHEHSTSVEVAVQRGWGYSVLPRFNACLDARWVVLTRCNTCPPTCMCPSVFIAGPLSRFGDTAANVGMLTLLNSSTNTKVSAMHSRVYTFLHAHPSSQGFADPCENFCCVLGRLCVSDRTWRDAFIFFFMQEGILILHGCVHVLNASRGDCSAGGGWYLCPSTLSKRSCRSRTTALIWNLACVSLPTSTTTPLALPVLSHRWRASRVFRSCVQKSERAVL